MCTDSNLLTYLFTTPNLNACGHRWVVSLANFNFTIKYQQGKNNTATDALSQVNDSLDAIELKATLDGTSVRCQDWAELPELVAHLGEVEDLMCVSAV